MLKIALCDDEPIFQKKLTNMIKQKLNRIGTECDIVCFASGEELVGKIRQNACYDILFLDVNMQGIDGLETKDFFLR